MHILTTALAVISAVTAALAAEPVIEPQQLASRQDPPPLGTPADGTVLLCSMPGYSPECANAGYYNFICIPMPFSLKQTLQSAKLIHPTNHFGKCVFYRNLDCTGGSSPEVPAAGIDNFQASGIYGLWQAFYCWNGTLTTGTESAPPTAKPEQDDRALRMRDQADGFFYYCSLAGFGGACSTTPYYSKQCMPVPDAYHGSVQAATPVVNYNAACFVYREENCQGDRTQALVYPGDRNFKMHGNYGFWKSWYCDCGEACPNKNGQGSDAVKARDKGTVIAVAGRKRGLGRRGT